MSISLRALLELIDDARLHGRSDVSVHEITHDSRMVEPGWIFAAIPGDHTDGHAYIPRAVQSGASAILAQNPPSADRGDIPWIEVPNTRKILGIVAGAVHGNPSEHLTLVGITGTNGKTTLTYLLESVVREAGGSPGVMGTISHRWGGEELPARHTTPEATDIQRVLAHMVRDGVTHAITEVSSHGLDLDRLEGCNFDIGVFTNLSQDHLDYHRDMEDYFRAKKKLFAELLPASTKFNTKAAINADDAYGRRLMEELGGHGYLSFAVDRETSVRCDSASIGSDGIRARIETPDGMVEVRSALTGAFNLSNILAAVAVSHALGMDLEDTARGIEAVESVPGRVERVASSRASIFVDYAHTPDALRNVLEGLAALGEHRIVTIMGCGGDRDKTKRPLMGAESARLSDAVIVTSDNPRTEDPGAIIADIVAGVRSEGLKEMSPPLADGLRDGNTFHVIPDRREAIMRVVPLLQEGDILLVAGKGHETYQEIHGVRYPFDDREIIRDALKRHGSRTDTGAQGIPCGPASNSV